MAPKRAFGGVLRPFGGGFRGPNRERASVFSSAGRGAERGSSAVQEGRGRGGLRCGTGGPTCSAVEPGAQKKRTSVRSLLFLLHYSATLRASAPGCSSDTPCRTTTAPHSGSPSLLRETSGSMFSCNSLSAFDFGLPVGRGHSRESLRHPEPQPLSRPPVGAQPPGRRNLSRPGSPRARRSRSGRPRERRRPPPGSQFSAARGHSSQPSVASAVRSPELAVPAARPLRRRGHSTTTSVWPSTCNWRISCVELT